MKIDNTNSKMRFNNYKDLSKYVIYVNPKQYVRMMRRRLERDRFLDLKCRPRKVYVPIAIRELSKGIIQHDDIVSDLSKLKSIPSKIETSKNYEGLMNKPNCNNINIYINDPLNNSNQSNNSVNNTNSANSFNNTSINYNMNNNMSNWPSFYWNMTGYYNMNTSRYNTLFPTYTTNDGVNEQSNNGNNNTSNTVPNAKNMDYNTYNQTSNILNPNNPYYQNNNNTLNNTINNSNQSNNTINNTNTTDNFNNSNINYNMNNDMSNWPSFYWNMTGYYNMNTSRYNTLFPTYTTNDGVDQNNSNNNSNNNGNNNNGSSVPPSKNMDYNSYNQTSNMLNPNNPYYQNNNNTLNNTINNSNQSNNTINNTNSTTKREELINNSGNNKSVKNEEYSNLIQGGYKGYDGLMTNQGFSSNSSTSSSFYNINSPTNMNHMYITNNFDSGTFSNTAVGLTSSGSINESHSSISSSGGYNVPITERDKNNTNTLNNNTINKREEILNNYINLNNSPFTDCSIDTEVVCKTEQIYNINENGTVIDTNLGDELTIGINEPMYFNSNLISNIDENIIGNIIDSNCVTSSCYLDNNNNNGKYNDTHLQSILMNQNSINTTSTIINDHDIIFNNPNSINTNSSIHSINSFEERIQGEGREQIGISTRHSDSNDSTYIYRKLCDFF